MRTQMAAKLFQYAGVLAIFAAASIVAHSWLLVQGCLLALCGIEITSIWENASKLQSGASASARSTP